MRFALLGLCATFAFAGCGSRSQLLAPDVDPPDPPPPLPPPPPPPCVPADAPLALTGTLRDFSQEHPDFEQGVVGDDVGFVAAELGPDGTPVYSGGEGTATTNGAASFDQWFHDVPGVNESLAWTAPLVGGGASWSYGSEAFFPLDGLLLGNEGWEHNFHFTLEAHGSFLHAGGESFTFGGDDDLFAFVAGELVVDLGGIHSSETKTVFLDDLGLEKGVVYPFDLFFAERQTSGSTFTLSLQGFAFCAPP